MQRFQYRDILNNSSEKERYSSQFPRQLNQNSVTKYLFQQLILGARARNNQLSIISHEGSPPFLHSFHHARSFLFIPSRSTRPQAFPIPISVAEALPKTDHLRFAPLSLWCENERYRSYLQCERKRNLLVDKNRPGEAELRRKKRERGREGRELMERERERSERKTMAPWDHHQSPLSLPHEFFPCFVSPRRDTFQSRNLKLVNYLTIVVSQPPTFAVHSRLSVPDNREGVFLYGRAIFQKYSVLLPIIYISMEKDYLLLIYINREIIEII